MGNLLVYTVSCLCLFLLVNLIKFFSKAWWIPIRIQSSMRSQGIRGPSYRFLHGNTREISNMRNRIMNGPMELSHQMLPRLQPHIYSWIKLYGNVDLLAKKPSACAVHSLTSANFLQAQTFSIGMDFKLNWLSLILSWFKRC